MKLSPDDIEITVNARQFAIMLAALRYAEENPDALTEHLSYSDEPPATADEVGDVAVWVNCG